MEIFSNLKMPLACCQRIPQRAVLCLLTFLGIVIAQGSRTAISLAITQIVVDRDEDGNKIPDPSKYDWSEALQGTILSSFYWGYVISHLPGGIIADKLGGKWVFSLGHLMFDLSTFFTPMSIEKGGVELLIALRVFGGIGQGTMYPAVSSILASWIPVHERGITGAFVMSAAQIGTIAGNALTGLIIFLADDWRPAFYFWGAIGIIWFILYTFICYNSPNEHPFISEKEKVYLAEISGNIKRANDRPPVPWKMMLTNAAVLSYIVSGVGHDFGFYVMVTDLPKYMADVLNFDVKENGLYSALPYVCMWIVSLISGFVADSVLRKKQLTTTQLRIIWTTIGNIGPGIFMVIASYLGLNKGLVIGCFILTMGTMGPYYSGSRINGLDLSPNYSGILMALMNGAGALIGIIVPIMIGLMTPNRDLMEWRVVFITTFVVLTVSTIPYWCFGSGELQDFDDPIKAKADREAKKSAAK